MSMNIRFPIVLRGHDAAQAVRGRDRHRLRPRHLRACRRPRAGLTAGKLAFRLYGEKLEGLWELVKIAKGGERQKPWILFKKQKRDEFARARADCDRSPLCRTA